jgi:DNA-binding HxlR family transcriptional regulator
MKTTTPIDPALRMKYCPIVRSLARVGERWSMLILRDAFYGITRFDDFVNSLQIAPNMLTRRLTSLVEDGLLERRQYNEKPPRYEYVLTPLGRDFRPVLLALVTWGNQNFAAEGRSVVLKEGDGPPGRPRARRQRERQAHHRGRLRAGAGHAAGAGPKERTPTRAPASTRARACTRTPAADSFHAFRWTASNCSRPFWRWPTAGASRARPASSASPRPASASTWPAWSRASACACSTARRARSRSPTRGACCRSAARR